MSRLVAAVFLVAVGLGIGLWLGYDPHARAAVEENWARAKSSAVQIQSDMGTRINGSGAESQASKDTAPGGPIGRSPLAQVPKALETFWRATQQLFFSLLARLDISP